MRRLTLILKWLPPTLNMAGSPGSRGLYTAASKESLNIGMLALITSRARLAWHWINGASGPDDAAVEARCRLAQIVAAYESHLLQCPACGGFVAWKSVSDSGWGAHSDGDSLPALDNGQLAWSVLAAQVHRPDMRNLRCDSHSNPMPQLITQSESVVA